MNSLTHKVEALLREHHVSPDVGPMLCGLSGGADSVALVLVLKELGYDVRALHCNFQLRGEESERDEGFVRQFCADHDIPLLTTRFDTRSEAARSGESIEMAARRLRYKWFKEVRQEGAICVAHHADDNVETMLLNLIRGAGLHGLTGMDFCNDRGILRPLLTTTRRDIEAYLTARGQTFVTDSTNADTHYRRNMVRHTLLPLLRTMNPSIDRTLTATMAHLREAETLLETQDGDETFRQRRTFIAQGFTMTQITQMEQAREGAFTTAGGYMLTKHGGRLVSGLIPATLPPMPFEGIHRPLAKGENLRNPHVAIIDERAVVGDLFVRSVREGDRFRPFGMRGTKLVSDYLTDRHRSRLDKLAARVVCDAQGILWLVGETIDQRAAVTASTKNVVEMAIDH